MSGLIRITAGVLTAVILSLAPASAAFAQQHEAAEVPAEHVADHPQGAAAGHGAAEYAFTRDLAFWSGVAFILFLLVLWKMDLLNGIINALFTPVGEHERQAVESLAHAEQVTAEAQEILRQNRGRVEALDETIQAALNEAQRDADYVRNEVVAGAEKEAAGVINRVGQEISTVKDQTLHDIFDALALKVAEATEARLRKQLESSDQDRLIDETLARFSESA